MIRPFVSSEYWSYWPIMTPSVVVCAGKAEDQKNKKDGTIDGALRNTNRNWNTRGEAVTNTNTLGATRKVGCKPEQGISSNATASCQGVQKNVVIDSIKGS